MTKKIVIIIVGILIFFLGGLFVFLQTTSLPEFNQTIEGNVYAYTFNKVGNWSFQNQKKPTDQGTITVTD